MFNIAVPGDAYNNMKGLVEQVTGHALTMKVRDSDSINIEYEVAIDYVGNIAERLLAIIQLRAMGIPVDVNIKELTDGRCLFAEIVQHLDTVLENA